MNSKNNKQNLREQAKAILASGCKDFTEKESPDFPEEARKELALRSIEKSLLNAVTANKHTLPASVVILLERNGNIIYTDKQAQKLLEIGANETRNVSFSTFLAPNYREIFGEMLENAYSTGELQKSIIRLYHSAHDIMGYNLAMSYFPRYDYFVLLLIENAMPSATLSNKLQQKAFRMFVENVKDVIWIYNAVDQKLEYVSPSVYELTGYTQREFLNLSVYQFYTPEYAEKTQQGLEREEYIKGMFSERVREKQVIRKDGRIIWTEEHFNAMLDADGTFTGRLIGISRDITRRKTAENKLKESRERYRMLFYDNYSTVLIIDPVSLRIEDANNAACNFYNYDYKELTSLKFTDLTIAEDQAVARVFRQIRECGRLHFTAKQYLADESVRNTEVYSGLMYLEKRPLIYAIVHDITDRVIAENKLKAERKQFLSLLNSINQIIYVADRNYHILFANKTFRERFGQNVLDKKCYRVIQNKEVPCGFCTNPIIFNQKEAYAWEQYNKKTDSYFYVIDKAIKWYNGTDARFTLAIDITRMKKAEFTNRKLSAAVEQSYASIVMTDPNGTIEYVNSAFENKTGYSYNEAIGQNPRILKSGKNSPKLYENLWTTILSGKVWKGMFVNRRKNGEEYYENAIITPIQDENNRITHFVSIKDDVTQQKLAEEALKKSEAELKEANAAKDKFFSIIAHDLKNPFNTLLGFTELLLLKHRNFSEEKLEQYIRNIYESAQRNYDLVRNLLIWSRSQSGRMEFTPQVKPLKSLVDPNVQLIKDTAGQKQVNIEVEMPDDIYVYADENMIRTTIRNLMSNALKFTPKNGRIAISASKRNKHAEIAISDTGVGIPKEHIPKLFRIDESYSTEGTQKEKGTGLGLILCKEFIEKNGGKIWVESVLNEGSTFYFTLPTIEQQDKICADLLDPLKQVINKDEDLKALINTSIAPVIKDISGQFSSQGVKRITAALEEVMEKHNSKETQAIYDRIVELKNSYKLTNLQQCLKELAEMLQDVKIGSK